jgi:hypothetical protein
MNKTILYVTTGMLIAGMISCGSAETAKTKSADKETILIAENASDCLSSHFAAIDGLFTLDLVVSEINLPKDKAKTKYSKPGKNMNYHSLTYSWEGSRKRQMQVGDRTMEVPRLDVVTISGFETMDIAQFKKVYRTLSAEEKENAKKAIDEELEKQKASETTKNLSDGVGSDLIAGQVYEEVPGVGTTALWHPAHGQLLVLSGTSKFVIFVDVYDDLNENRAISIALAKALIKACGE